MTSATDENSKSTTWTFNDANYWRPRSVQDPALATTNLSYFTGPVAAESTLNFNGTISTLDTRATLDGSGRLHVGQTKQSQTSTSYDSIETDYDSLGRVSRVTVPYTGSARTGLDSVNRGKREATSIGVRCSGSANIGL
jgi:hypothetical protein